MPPTTLNSEEPANRHSFILSFSFSAMLKIFKVIDFIRLINMLKKIKIFT